MKTGYYWGLTQRPISWILIVCLMTCIFGNSAVVLASAKTGSSTLTEEERLNSTYNPIYMGADIDYRGEELIIGEGPKGQIHNQATLDHQEQYAEGKVYKVTDRVYVANGFGLANSAMIIGDTGITIVDTNDCSEASQKEYEEFKKISNLPVKNIIFSHYHYTFGTTTYVNEDNKNDVTIYAHEGHSAGLANAASEISKIYTYRNAVQQAGMLPFEGVDGATGCGLGPFMTDPELEKHTSGYIAPTELISGERVTEVNIDGVRVQFIPSAADSLDSMTIWLPDERVAINNHVWPTFPNIYTLRGEAYRDPLVWIEGLDKIIALNPEHIATVHGIPFSGTQEEIKEQLITYRDGIQFLYDQTLRYMNKGYSEDEVVQAVKLPKKFTSGKINGEFYGEMEYYIRAIYHGNLGWFDGDVQNIHPVSDSYEAEQLVAGFGGIEKVIKESKAVLEDKQYSWAAQLATYVLEIEPNNEAAKKTKVEALRKMAQVTTAENTRNFMLSQMNELQGVTLESTSNSITKDKLMGSPRDTFLKTLSVSIDPKKAKDMDMMVKFVFPDEKTSYGLQVENAVGLIVKEPKEADVTITVDYETLCDLICGNIKPVKTILSGKIGVDGSIFKLIKFVKILDMKL